ncbi:hypothetical protein HDV06_001409 [Boothiomyces sp. JEL0866]|nr:hypothetical protein HDV06_001409 [Boothiomyces sp. JEL0866]
MSSVGSTNGITGSFGPNVTAIFNTTAPDYSQYPPVCVSAISMVGQSCYSTTLASTNIVFAPTNLDQLCGSTCGNAIKYFSSILPQCGSIVIEPFSKTTGLLLYSYLELIANYACVKDAGNYCYLSQAALLQQAGVSLVGPDAFSNVIQFIVSNNTVLCSTCFKTQFQAISSLKDLDPSLYPQLQTGAGLIQKQCVTTTTTSKSMTSTQSSTSAPTATTTSSGNGLKSTIAAAFAVIFIAFSQ